MRDHTSVTFCNLANTGVCAFGILDAILEVAITHLTHPLKLKALEPNSILSDLGNGHDYEFMNGNPHAIPCLVETEEPLP